MRVSQKQGAFSDPSCILDGSRRLTRANGVREKRNLISIASQLFEVIKGLRLMGIQINECSTLARKVLLWHHKADRCIQQERQMFTHSRWLVLELPVRPAQNSPALVYQTVLANKLVGVLVVVKHGRMVERLAIDLDSVPIEQRLQNEIDKSTSAIDVFVGNLRHKLSSGCRAEHLLKELDKSLFRSVCG